MSLDEQLITEAFSIAQLAKESGWNFKTAFESYVYAAKFIDDLEKRRDYFLDMVDYYTGGMMEDE